MCILIRREEKKGKHYEHTFYSPQIPRLIGYTNYRNTTERFQWKIVAGDVWEWRQINRNYRVLDYIPIVNVIKSFALQLKYKIYKNEMCIGNAFFNGIHSKNYFQVYNKKYFCCPGNTNIIRPFKKYKWTIENDKCETVVNIEQEYGRSVYKIERLDTDLSVELIMVSSLIIYFVKEKDRSVVIQDTVFGIVLCLISFFVFCLFFKIIRKALKKSIFRTITTVFSICMLISILFLWIGMLAFPSEEAIINNQFMIVGAYLGCKTSRSFLDNGRVVLWSMWI